MKNFITSPPTRGTWQATLLGALLAISAGAQAAGTLSGTDIENIARLSYSVGGTPQGDICSSEAGNTVADTDSSCANNTGKTTFKVDNKVNLTLVENGSTFTSVAAGAQNQATSFTLTNTGNTAQGYTLSAANIASTVFSTADTFDVSNFEYYIDNGTIGVLDGADVLVTAITSLAPDASVNLLVVADIPVAQANGTQAAISLTATAVTATTLAALSETANTQSGVEIVFADAASTSNLGAGGTDPGQIARNAAAVAVDAYRVATAVVSVSKTATVICDPFNGSTDAKNIPGAIVRWTVTVSNAAGAGASATLATISDTLDSNTTHDANLVTGAGAPATATSCTSAGGTPSSAAGHGFRVVSSTGARTLGGVSATGYMTNAAGDNDGASISGQVVTINFAQALPVSTGTSHAAGELKAGESATVTFNVTIN